MPFAIMRFAKLKTGGPINGSISHITRSRETPNADPQRRHLNRAIVGEDNSAAIHAAIEERTPAKYRKDAVRALEFIITATPEWFDQNPDQVDAYFDSAVEWLRQEFGAENVVSAVQHNDELTPHMHAMVVPIDPETGRLNAKKWVGGRGKMRQMQSDFATFQSEFGVERGKPRSGRKHTPVRDWYDGHAQLDEREAALAERERAVHYDSVDIEGREAEIEGREQELGHREAAVAARAESLDERERGLPVREQEVDQRERAVTAERRELARRARALEEREAAMAARAAQLEDRERGLPERERDLERGEAALAERERRLDALKHELAARGERLQGGEAALEQRLAEIDRAGQQLSERLDAMRQWAQRHRPDGADLLDGLPRPVPAFHRQGLGDAAADWHDQGLDDVPQPRPRRNDPNGPTF